MDFSNLEGLMGQAMQMQAQMQEAQDKLSTVIVEAEAGGGMVRVKANGAYQITNIEIDPTIIDKDDPGMLEDLLLTAINRALAKAKTEGEAFIQHETRGAMPDLSSLGGLLGK